MVDALKLYANNLEDRVIERTRDLTLITEQLAEEVKRTREAQDKLFHEKERLDVTLHSIGEGVILTDTEGTILLANHIAEHIGTMPGRTNGCKILTVLPMLDPLTNEIEIAYWVAKDHDCNKEQKGVIMNQEGCRDLS